MKVKKCNICKREKPILEFYEDNRLNDGRSSSCKICVRKRTKIWGKAYYLKNRDLIRMKTRQYQKDNKDKVAIYSQKHYEGKRGLRADLTPEQWEIIKRVFKHRCVYCGKKTKRLEREHVIPVSKGGNLTLRNIVPACRACNAKKRANLPEVPVKILLF